MRIVIDLQGAQTESRFRGIGRYSLSLAKAIAQQRGQHEVLIALNGLFPETIEPIRNEFRNLLPREHIQVWHGVAPTRECNRANSSNRRISEHLREAAILGMRPDVVLITSLFEGFGDEAITSVGLLDAYTPTVSLLYDLIPLIAPDENYRSNPIHIGYYRRKLESLKRCSALLAISESARNEAIQALGIDDGKVTNISSGCDLRFKPQQMSNQDFSALRTKFKISRPFVMYTGGADERKNLSRLIKAFAGLPQEVRYQHQLVMVGKMPSQHVDLLQYEAKQAGLTSGDLLFTGYVSDLELMQLYTACQLFVFPSLHEGFGLPPLEAMACGAPVIAARSTSLPEVIGRQDALFDPLSVADMSQKMREVLTHEMFRNELIDYGRVRVSQFSWNQCAITAIAAMSTVARPSNVINSEASVQEINTTIFKPRALRILVCKLDHLGDWILALPAVLRLKARYPDALIDALVGNWNVTAAESLGFFDRVYALDFFQKKSETAAKSPKNLDEVIQRLPHYDIAIDLRRPGDTRFILAKINATQRIGYSCGNASINAKLDICLPILEDTAHVMTGFNRESTSLQMLRLIDSLPSNPNDYVSLSIISRPRSPDQSGVALFPNAGNAVKEWGTDNFKSLIMLLNAVSSIDHIGVFLGSANESNPYRDLSSAKLIFHEGLSQDQLRTSLSSYRVCVGNNSYGVHLASLLGLEVVGIYGGHETVAEWGPVFGDARVLSAPVPCSPCHIPDLTRCVRNLDCLKLISPERVLRSVLDALDGISRLSISEVRSDLIRSLTPELVDRSDEEIKQVALVVSKNLPFRNHKRLYIDISEIAIRDARTGIQRVVRSILDQYLNLNIGYEVVPVYATTDQIGYRIASKFLAECNHHVSGTFFDDPIDYQAGDIFLGLDFQPLVAAFQRPFYKTLRQAGVRVSFVAYDLLCLSMPQFFDPGLPPAFTRWLEVVCEQNAAICISKATANELSGWIKNNTNQSRKSLIIKWFHMGADISNSIPSLGIPENSVAVIGSMKKNTSFLMVGTIEPRKGHADTLNSFEALWKKGAQVCLVLVGKQGWMVDALAERIRNHSEYGQRLIWLEAISDEYLELIYSNADCLIAASMGEGFGLPLIEAARHGIPIIARDLPVFREVAGDHAFYFSGVDTTEFSEEIENWLRLFGAKIHPSSKELKFLTWAQSARELWNCLASLEAISEDTY